MSQSIDRSYRVHYRDELNPEQIEVVMHPGGPMLVLAGAGTGKTRTLVYRTCRLIEDGVPPSRILLLTFTNKAAREMMDRVDALTEGHSGRVMGGTFHSAGHRILRRYAELLGYSPRFSILDREDATDLMGNALADVSPEQPRRRTPKPRTLIDLYSYIINTGSELDEVLLERAPQFYDQGELIASVFKRYLERKRAADVMDFDDLLLNWLILLTRFGEARSELAARFAHILVDEYQDTNRLQADIIDGMLGSERNVMVVGDDAQSIYGFRGADFENIIGFPERHLGCAVFRLETNYRSVPSILELANASIINNTRRFDKNLEAIRTGGELPALVATPTPELQASFVADTILEQREQGVALEDVAVLYRNHSHSLDLQVELTRRNIPYRVRSGLRFFEHRHVKDVLAHLRFVDNPRDEIAFARLVKLRPGFGPRLALRLWDQVRTGDPLHGTIGIDARSAGLPVGAAQSLLELQHLLEELASPRLLGQPGEAIRETLRLFYHDWARNNLDNARSRLDDLEQLALFADGYPDVHGFLADVTLLNDLSGEEAVAGPPDEQLTLSTSHQAKGLEWKVVFVIWLAEGRFPTIRAEDDEEERRLFYVSVTRARDSLYLVYPEIARDRYRVDVIVEPSRFIAEIPDGLTRRITVAAQPEPDLFPPLPGQKRYAIPSFFDQESDPDDGVN